jgi:hypothetical protein
MYVVELRGTDDEGKPFSTRMSEEYELRRDAVKAGERLIVSVAGIGKSATSFEMIDLSATEDGSISIDSLNASKHE